MGVLVEDMLLLARLDQQRPLERRPVDLLTLAADAVHDARVIAPERSINLTVGPARRFLVLGDEVRLRQVIGNLMSNALTHTPDGTPIEVRIRSGPTGAGQRRRPSGRCPAVDPRGRRPGPGPDPGAGRAGLRAVLPRGPGPEPARRAAPASAWRSWPRWSPRTAAPSPWIPPPGSGATFRIALPLAPEAPPDGRLDEAPRRARPARIARPGADVGGPGRRAGPANPATAS